MSKKDSVTSLQTHFQYLIKNQESYTQNQIKDEHQFILTEEEKAISNDIIKEYGKKVEDFQFFLNKQFAEFDYKVNKCQINFCYDNIYKPRGEVIECIKTCKKGITQIDSFVSSQVDTFLNEFNECIELAQKNRKDIMKESFLCYDQMLKGFLPLKKVIKNEFNYYQ